MRSARLLCALVTALVVGAQFESLRAADFAEEFLKEARGRGYGKVSVDYLTMLQESGKMPSELKETWDLEMSKALRIAAQRDAFNPKERDEWQAKSKEFLEKFVKEHADSPDVASAQISFGDMALERGLQQMRLSRSTRDKEAKTKYLTEARKAFTEARPRFTDAADRYKKRFEEMQEAFDAGKTGKGSGNRRKKAEEQLEEALFDWFDSRFKTGLVEFYFGTTIEDVKDKARTEALQKAAKTFDDIYQENRESLVGLTAHAWHGKAMDEGGQYEDASDIYEEVLANVPDNLAVETGLEGLFAQVFYFKALLEIKKGKSKEFLATAGDWRKTYKPWKRYEGYQGISLEYAKLAIEAAEKAPADQKRKIMAEVNTVLNEGSRIPGEHQDEIILLIRSLKKSSGDTEAGSVDEAMALADSAIQDGDWDAAEKAVSQALDLAKKSKMEKEKKRIGEIETALDQTRYRHAVALFTDEKYDDVLKICGEIAKKKDSDVGPLAAALAVSASLNLYAQAQEPEAKEKALERLSKIAEYTIKTWPDKAEADDARISMGKAKLVQGKYDEAIKVFEDVNPRSERYGIGRFIAGQTHWRLYQGEKNSDPDKAADRAKQAEERLTEAVEILRKQAVEAKANNGTPPAQLPEAELLLGEVYVETGNGAKAVELLEPQLAEVLKNKPAVENNVLRIFLASVRAYMAAGNLPKASEASLALVEMGPDQPQINKILVGFATMLNEEFKKADADVIDARSTNDLTAKEEAATKLKGTSEMLGKLLEKLVARQQMDTKSLMFMGQTAMKIERPDIAEPVYKVLVGKIDAGDPAIDKRMIPGIRAPLIGIMRAKGDYAEALVQIDKQIEAYPNALEPLMEKGRILQAWSEKDKTKFADAVANWTLLRQKLQGSKVKPPEYYDVIYNTSLCLVMEGEQNKDNNKKIEGAKLLNALLFTSPKLNGPDTVARYKELLKRADPEGYKKREAAEKAKAKEEKEREKEKAKANAKAKETAAK